jgi:NIPSNAP
LKRVEHYTLQLFEKHGIKPLGLWTVAIGGATTICTCCWNGNLWQNANKKFAAFLNDPQWLEVRRKGEENGPLESSITNTILVPSTF